MEETVTVLTAGRNSRGFTLIEVMVAIVILAVGLLGLLYTVSLSIDNNLANVLRDEAIKVAEQRMSGTLVDKNSSTYEGLKNLPFDSTALQQTDPNWSPIIEIHRDFRSFRKSYYVTWKIKDLSANSKSLDVAVGWDFKGGKQKLSPTGMPYQHSISSVISNPS